MRKVSSTRMLGQGHAHTGTGEIQFPPQMLSFGRKAQFFLLLQQQQHFPLQIQI